MSDNLQTNFDDHSDLDTHSEGVVETLSDISQSSIDSHRTDADIAPNVEAQSNIVGSFVDQLTDSLDPLSEPVHCSPATQSASDGLAPQSEIGQTAHVTLAVIADLAPIVGDIIAEHMRRQAAIKAQRRLDQSAGSMARRLCGWRVDMDEKERTRLNKRAERIVKALEKSAPLDPEDEDIAEQLLPFVTATLAGRQPFDMLRKNAEKTLADRARKLPVWPWVGAIRGIDAGSLAAIVGEAGDLSNYSNPAKLWKRLGLAVMSGQRQGNPGAKATTEDWIKHGYSGRRRSVVWNIGHALVMCNQDGKYRAIYLARKDYEKARDPEMSKGHASNRAQRYMEKRFVRDLWAAWRAANNGDQPCQQ